MSADSLFGGTAPGSLSANTLALLNHFLTDTVGGSAITAAFGSSTYVSGTGTHGEFQGGVLPGVGALSGTIDDGALQLTLNLPGKTGFVFEGMDSVSPDAAGAFLHSVVSSYNPHADQKASVDSAVDQLVLSLKAQGVSNVSFRVFDFMADAGSAPAGALGAAPSDTVIDASANSGVQALAINLLHAGTVVLKGVEQAVVANTGTIRVEGNTPIHLVGDLTAQDITGGGGNDTLVGGGGNDTLTGGLGSDVFG